MLMVRLIYVSRMTDDCDILALQKILEVSRAKNREKDITGVLCYDPAFFLQCLEGPRFAVNELYAAIQQDSRHRDVLLLEYSDTDTRMFADWSMAFLKTNEVSREVIARYTGHGKFDPYLLTADQAREFLVETVAAAHTELAKQRG